MLERGYLVNYVFFAMLAHEPHHVEAFVDACDPVFAEMGRAIKDSDIEPRIGGPVKHTGSAAYVIVGVTDCWSNGVFDNIDSPRTCPCDKTPTLQ